MARRTRRTKKTRRVKRVRRSTKTRRTRKTRGLHAAKVNNRVLKLTLLLPLTNLTAQAAGGPGPAAPALAYGQQFTTDISQYPRAVQFQQLYQQYRITSMRVMLKPNANVAFNQAQYTGGIGAAFSANLPYVQAFPWSGVALTSTPGTFTESWFDQMGVNPIPFTRPLSVGQKPVVYQSATVPNQAGPTLVADLMPRRSPWLTTFNNTGALDTTTHYGPIARVVTSPLAAPDVTYKGPGQYQVRVTVEFRGPTYVAR